MRYTPKHSARRPRNRRAAGVTLASAATLVAGLTVTAPAAQAQDGVWDRVAACESGGNWSTNTGNGYYGGLQFAQATWVGYGGQAYASQANLASRSQQISIAQKVLAGQGPGAWPTCSVKAGLTRSNGGASSSAAPAPAPAPAPKSAPQPAPAPSQEQGEQSASRNAPAQQAAPAPTQQAAPAPAQKAAPAPTQQAAPAPTREHTQKAPVQQVSAPSYTVASGDTVAKIAARFGSSISAIVSANGLSDNGRLIFPGDTLVVPGGNMSAPAPTSPDYTVRSGDVLWRIAMDQGTTVDAIVAANDLANPDLILPGQTLAIPGS